MVKITDGMRALTTREEQMEIKNVGRVKLVFRGFQEWPGHEPLRLWDINAPWHPFHDSTRTEDGLRELGIIQ